MTPELLAARRVKRLMELGKEEIPWGVERLGETKTIDGKKHAEVFWMDVPCSLDNLKEMLQKGKHQTVEGYGPLKGKVVLDRTKFMPEEELSNQEIYQFCELQCMIYDVTRKKTAFLIKWKPTWEPEEPDA